MSEILRIPVEVRSTVKSRRVLAVIFSGILDLFHSFEHSPGTAGIASPLRDMLRMDLGVSLMVADTQQETYVRADSVYLPMAALVGTYPGDSTL